MLSKPLTAFAACYDFNLLDDYAYGTIGNYVVCVKNDGYKKAAFIAFYNLEDDGEGANLANFKLSEQLNATELPALKNYEICDGGLLIRTGCDLKFFDEAVTTACNILAELGFPGTDKCTYCGEEISNDDAYLQFNGLTVNLLCKECANDFLNTPIEEQTKEKGHRKLGVLASATAALLCFVLFSLLYAFVIPYNGLYTSGGTLIIKALVLNMPFSALTTFASFFVYRLVTGKKGVQRLLPCGLSALVAAVLTSYAASAIVFANQFGLKLAQAKLVIGNILRSPFIDPLIKKEFLQCLLYSVLTVIAVVLIYSIIFEDKKKIVSFLVKFGETDTVTSLSDTSSPCEGNGSDNNTESI